MGGSESKPTRQTSAPATTVVKKPEPVPEPSVVARSKSKTIEGALKESAYDDLMEDLKVAVSQNKLSDDRKGELSRAIKKVADNRCKREYSKEIDVAITETERKDPSSGWLRTKMINGCEIEVDMLAYCVESKSATEMDIKMAFCKSKIINARKESLSQVTKKLEEIVHNATANLDSFPIEGGLPELRKLLVADGTS